MCSSLQRGSHLKKYTHQELVNFLRMTKEGKILDSLFATELGLTEYATHWGAFQDILEWEGETGQILPSSDDMEERVAMFLIEMSNYVDFSDVDFLATAEAQ